ncbi:MAG TPA: CaiB/BaiF CoA-transferase family protein [Candidatus Limnocylindria bacterium]|jgi:crotonobetainyl-CoA:carnitine CoA-transferase CaiB-like acyl-CoA transferase|nr:CaiB/BaiF CoA-transferase family protein [Candidatus Limnocylindria bacterium]
MLPLNGVRVVAVEHAVAAPLCTRHLADLGADVVKVERPGGDFARHYDAVVEGQSAYFVWLNRGKRSVVLDLERPSDRAVLEWLLAGADVFVHNLGPRAVERLGFSQDATRRRWPRLISCAISGYGSDGPYRLRKAFDLLVQAESGVAWVTGPAETPTRVGVPVADISAAMYACMSILAALRLREADGQGRLIDISMLDCLAEWMTAPAYYQLYGAHGPARAGLRHPTIVPYGAYPCSDGEVLLAVQNEAQWKRLCEDVLRDPGLAADQRFRTNALRVDGRATLEGVIERALSRMSRASIEKRLEGADLPFARLNTVSDLIEHPQLVQRKRWTEVDSGGKRVKALRSPFNIIGLDLPMAPVPELDAHGAIVRREAGG